MKDNPSIAFIGGGNMATAIIRGMLDSNVAAANDITVSAPTEATRDRLSKKFGIHVTADNQAAAADADVLILAVKPKVLDTVVPEISGSVNSETLVISIAAGRSIADIQSGFSIPMKIIRSMPNTPAMVGEAMSALCASDGVTGEEQDYALKLFSSFGRAEYVSEALMPAVTGVSGSSPAFVYMFIEAMTDAAVAAGMPREKAYTFAAQSVYGSAKMVLETGLHPGVLKDQVTSPAGTTIAGVKSLEEHGFRGAVMDAILAASK